MRFFNWGILPNKHFFFSKQVERKLIWVRVDGKLAWRVMSSILEIIQY
jgi:hypothetical protein